MRRDFDPRIPPGGDRRASRDPATPVHAGSAWRHAFVAASAVLASVALIRAGDGVLTTAITLHMARDGVPDEMIGVMGSAYFAGLILGPILCIRMVERVGPIRTLSVMVTGAGLCVLGLALIGHPLAWIAARAAMGCAVAGFYVLIESWLRDRSTAETRSRILTSYTGVQYLSYAAAQILILIPVPDGGGALLLAGVLVAASVLPVFLSSVPAPEVRETQGLGPVALFRLSPLGVAATFAGGLVSAPLGVLAPLYGVQMGFPLAWTVGLVAALFVGGLLLKWPIGRASDLLNRRLVLVLLVFAAAGASALMVAVGQQSAAVQATVAMVAGGLAFTLTPLAIAHANDHLDLSGRRRATAGLVTLWGVGAIIGPAAAAVAMDIFGPAGLFLFIAATCLCVGSVGLLRMTLRPSVPKSRRTQFIPLPQQGSFMIAALDPLPTPAQYRLDLSSSHDSARDTGEPKDAPLKDRSIRNQNDEEPK